MREAGDWAPFSEKQLTALTWWCEGSPFAGRDAIICDGAVRSGKTTCMALGFIAWATRTFHAADFALCGKTIASLRRNVVVPLLPLLRTLGFSCREERTRNLITIGRGKKENRFYLFGGRDEGAAALIQGITLGGVLFDEVALMPRSFVEQALARCSMEGAKYWFNCNPEYPRHWFHMEWILQAERRGCLYLHFRMEDNPSLSPAVLRRYRGLYSGAFYERFIEGKWTAALGLVYPFFSEAAHVVPAPPGDCNRYAVSCDYGTVNPASFGLWGECGGIWYRIEEFYYDSRREGEQKTDEEYYAALETLIGERPVEQVVVDPSAASFLACIRRHGRYRAVPAVNEVLDGIRRVADALRGGKLRFCAGCRDILREFGLYRWEEGRAQDAPHKENDHAMDDLRYFVTTVMGEGEAFFSLAVTRQALI